MPVVPYKPYADRTPEMRQIPTLSPHAATPEAFGANIGAALQLKGGKYIEYGQDLSALGGEVSKSGEYFQQLNNETRAKNDDVNFMADLGKLEADYDQQRGLNSVNALDKFQNDVKALRQKYLANSPNLEARQMLDNSIARRVGFSLIDAGRRAATQAKEAARSADGLRLDTLKSNVSL